MLFGADRGFRICMGWAAHNYNYNSFSSGELRLFKYSIKNVPFSLRMFWFSNLSTIEYNN